MESGTLKWFDEAKGYGCIRRENGEEVHVPISAIQASGSKALKAGETVQFDVIKGQISDVRVLEEWQALLGESEVIDALSSVEHHIVGPAEPTRQSAGLNSCGFIFGLLPEKQEKNEISEISSAYVAPRTPTEKKIATIWALSLGKKRVGTHDNFFKIGGHSLLAVSIMQRMKEAFGTYVSLYEFFKDPTIAAMAKIIEGLFQPDSQQSGSRRLGGARNSSTLGAHEMLSSVRKKLGSHMPLKSDSDLVTLVEERLPVATISSLMKHGVLEKEIYSVIIPRRTLQHRRTRKEKLSREESDRAVRLARLAALTEKVFGDHKEGMHWLRSPKKRFQGRAPMVMMETETGSRLVEEALYQIDEGMAA